MSEEDTPPQPPPDPDADDEEAAWERLSPRLRDLVRGELEEHEQRRSAAAPKPEKKPDPEPEKKPEPKSEEKPVDDSRPRRTAYDRWFGGRR